MAPQIELSSLSLGFDGRCVVRDVSFALARGRIGCLLGPSGSGKTTLLRAIAGFEIPLHGEISINGAVVSRKGWALAPEKRHVGMVFQDFALFPNLTVRDNIGFGIRSHGRAAIKTRVDELLELVGLGEAAGAYPHQLSGGQQQRVALARAMAPRPEILLLDEPFSSLDTELREHLAGEVRAVLRHERITALFVTHNHQEAFAMADEIGVINQGSLMQWGSGYEVYHRPRNRSVADFIGQGVYLRGKVLNGHGILTGFGVIDAPIPKSCGTGPTVEILVRPYDVIPDDHSPIRARIVDKTFHGATFQYTLRLSDGAEIVCVTPSRHDHEVDDEIGIRFEPKVLSLFPADGG